MASVMDTLPDEVLVHVLSFVEDGATLLDVAPLVCHRWRRLSRVRGAWRGARLEWGGEMEDDDDGDELIAARVLLHAPVLHTLVLRGWSLAEAGWLPSALRRCRVVVQHHLHVGAWLWLHVPDPGRGRLLDLMWRSRYGVRILGAPLSLRHVHDLQAAHPVTDGQGRTPLDVLAGMARLTWLELAVGHFDYPYAGELAGAWPSLRRFELVMGWDLLPGCYMSWPSPPGLVGDVLAAASATLRSVEMDSWPMPDDPAELLPLWRCAELRYLGVCHTWLAALEANRSSSSSSGQVHGHHHPACWEHQLDTLQVMVFEDTAVEAVQLIRLALVRCSRLARGSLRLVRLVVSDKVAERREETCASALRAFARVRPLVNVSFDYEEY